MVITVLSWMFSLTAGTLQEDLTAYLSGDDMKPSVPGCKILNSVRLRPGKFGQSFLIERRTKNLADPADIILGQDATLNGPGNTLKLPADGFAALPLPQIKPGNSNCLSFVYSGSGKITVTLDSGAGSVTLAELDATANPQPAAISVIPNFGNTTLKISSKQPVTLDNLMFDAGIPFANTYHAPGNARNSDWISLPPELFDRTSGAFVCWLKAPWLQGYSDVSGIGILSVRWAEKTEGRFGANYLKRITVWNGNLFDINNAAAVELKLKDIKAKPVDGWHHFVFNWKFDDGKMTLGIIVDGEPHAEKTFSHQLNSEPIDFTIGYMASHYLNGQIDDIALFKRPLSLDEVRKIFSAGLPLPEAIK